MSKLKVVSLPVEFNRKAFYFNTFFGFLFSKTKPIKFEKKLNPKIQKHIDQVIDPFQLERESQPIHFQMKSRCLNLKAYLLTYTTFFSFYLGLILSKFLCLKFKNSSEAIHYYRTYIQPKNQQNLCLSRSLFAANSSKEFKNNGAIIIGVFLPSNSLHAWIIENNKIADKIDDIWINYQPVAVIYYN